MSSEASVGPTRVGRTGSGYRTSGCCSHTSCWAICRMIDCHCKYWRIAAMGDGSMRPSASYEVCILGPHSYKKPTVLIEQPGDKGFLPVRSCSSVVCIGFLRSVASLSASCCDWSSSLGLGLFLIGQRPCRLRFHAVCLLPGARHSAIAICRELALAHFSLNNNVREEKHHLQPAT